MAITKNTEQEKINSGNNFQIKVGSSWLTLGNIVSGSLEKMADSIEITHADGNSHKKASKRSCTLSVVLSQVAKEIMDQIDDILNTSVEGYFYNGRDELGADQEFYLPEMKPIEKLKLDMEGGKHQVLNLEFSVVAQSANVSVTPDTGLPADAYASGASPVTGKNPFYIILETIAA
ncbi:MAG: hypothetical protein IT280_13085 [Ignavibacteria bacterium]|nr:hypothetical protein [Ignavibacteria bacterium]